MNLDIDFSINNTQAVYSALVELGHPEFAELMLDISDRCDHMAVAFRQAVEHD